jgi:hypothetical protein
MYFGPLAGLLGAALASFSALKWVLLGFIVVIILWAIVSNKKNKNALDERALKDLIKSASQWNVRSNQDSNAMISLMNANYAMAYLNVARSIGSDTDIEKYTGAAVDELLNDIEASQSASIQKLTLACPAMAPAGLAAAHTGWTTTKFAK